MTTIKILHCWDGRVLYSHTAEGATMPNALKAALAAGADLRDSNLSGSNLSGSNLSGSNLSGADLSGADLRDSDLRDSDLRDSNLRDSNLRDSNLRNSDLSGSDLRNSNLSDSLRRLLAVPELDKKILAAIEAGQGKLEMGDWHGQNSCGTTHCRAGWAVTMAGPAGAVAEALLGTCAAGALIYAASYPTQRVPDFFHMDNYAVLANIRQRANQPAE